MEITFLSPKKSNELEQSGARKSRLVHLRSPWIFVIGLLVLVVLLLTLLLKKTRSELSLDQISELQKAEQELLVSKLSKHIVLPEGEPSIATVVNADNLKARSDFYALAENGSKIVLYADKAILYDSKRDIILNVAPVGWSELPQASQLQADSDSNQENGAAQQSSRSDITQQ